VDTCTCWKLLNSPPQGASSNRADNYTIALHPGNYNARCRLRRHVSACPPQTDVNSEPGVRGMGAGEITVLDVILEVTAGSSPEHVAQAAGDCRPTSLRLWFKMMGSLQAKWSHGPTRGGSLSEKCQGPPRATCRLSGPCRATRGWPAAECDQRANVIESCRQLSEAADAEPENRALELVHQGPGER